MVEHVISKQRVTDYGEVYTRDREVNAMLDLVQQETQRVDSRFLEPACGTGNFLTEILRRKLQVVEACYQHQQHDFECNAFVAVSSVYGIDILADNVAQCRHRLFEVFNRLYTRLYKDKTVEALRTGIRFVLQKNIIHGNALTLQTVDQPTKPIVFAEWSAINSSTIKRRDFVFKDMVLHASLSELPLFSDTTGEKVYIPSPCKSYPPIHFMRITDVA